MLFYTTIYKEIGRSSASRSQKTKKANMLDFDLMLNKLWSSSHLSNVRFSKENSFDLQFRWEKTKGFLAEFSSAKSKETRQMLLKERLKAIEGALSEVARCNPLAKFNIHVSEEGSAVFVWSEDRGNFSASFAIDLSDTKRPIKVCAKTGLGQAETPNMENQLLWLAEKMLNYSPELPVKLGQAAKTVAHSVISSKSLYGITNLLEDAVSLRGDAKVASYGQSRISMMHSEKGSKFASIEVVISFPKKEARLLVDGKKVLSKPLSEPGLKELLDKAVDAVLTYSF